ncbi:MAG: hypothetical protein KDD35_01900, partial [Bdellovibrionales bacterium]|nr:hypothetical protein [Bdellovibrionales bacterium]
LPNGSFQKGLESAQEDARRVKVNFKKKLGLLQDNEKYGVVASDQVPAKGGREIQDRRRNSEPQPLTPRIIEP